MIYATMENKKGEEFTVEMKKDIYQLYHILQDNGVTVPPQYIHLGDDKVTLQADESVGSHLLRLFTASHTLRDVMLMAQVVGEMQDDVRPQFERRLRENVYQSPEDVYTDLLEMKIFQSTNRISFYCPLEAISYDMEDEDYAPSTKYGLIENSDAISETLRKYQSPEIDMGICVGKQANLYGRVTAAKWNVEEIGGALYGRSTVMSLEN